MPPIILVFFLVLIPASQQYPFSLESLNDQIINEEVIEYMLENSIRSSRTRRVPDEKKIYRCGRRIHSYVFAVCGKACESNTEVNIASKCCREECTDDFIRKQCCP
ncbi:Insulin-like peptide 7 [Caenorhabditis elegans]|uniref:Insulin-like peptide 7 n=2 Tax=Caenorhabditis elegans TaxID=6239 RepID=ILB4_CAEEL|nr:Insulin-like peptide 7 [Caenorhabditis elegans]Q23430.1 RecName: Full=Insulin-like peptide 7; AltName: Full=Insulin-like peptide beta-type 4; Flags: Precursor [Caenorhabditis elegans]CAA92498.1 Insulin-like peptide 7 [Caenorhabditis elegans]|eukprot:NP_001255418.1 Probable insulin-like peptide beta-type 4 [Caenorhabditis elegans]